MTRSFAKWLRGVNQERRAIGGGCANIHNATARLVAWCEQEGVVAFSWSKHMRQWEKVAFASSSFPIRWDPFPAAATFSPSDTDPRLSSHGILIVGISCFEQDRHVPLFMRLHASFHTTGAATFVRLVNGHTDIVDLGRSKDTGDDSCRKPRGWSRPWHLGAWLTPQISVGFPWGSRSLLPQSWWRDMSDLHAYRPTVPTVIDCLLPSIRRVLSHALLNVVRVKLVLGSARLYYLRSLFCFYPCLTRIAMSLKRE
jgi:hypothetical protein